MCLNLEEGREMAQAAERAGVRLMVGTMKRYDPAYERMLEVLPDAGELRLVRVTTLESPFAPYIEGYALTPLTPGPAIVPPQAQPAQQHNSSVTAEVPPHMIAAATQSASGRGSPAVSNAASTPRPPVSSRTWAATSALDGSMTSSAPSRVASSRRLELGSETIARAAPPERLGALGRLDNEEGSRRAEQGQWAHRVPLPRPRSSSGHGPVSFRNSRAISGADRRAAARRGSRKRRRRAGQRQGLPAAAVPADPATEAHR